VALPAAIVSTANGSLLEDVGGQGPEAWWTPVTQDGAWSRNAQAPGGRAGAAVPQDRDERRPQPATTLGERPTPSEPQAAPVAEASSETSETATTSASTSSAVPAPSPTGQNATSLTDPLQPAGPVLLSGEHAVVNGERYTVQSPERPWSLSIHPTLGYSRFEVRPGDVWENDARLHPDGRQRVSMRGQTFWPNNTDVWFSYSVRTSAMPDSWSQLTSLHAELEPGETPGKPDPLGFMVSHGRFTIETRSDTRALTTSKADTVVRYSMPMFAPDTWQNIVVRVKFDPHGNGRLTFWLNGEQRYDSGAIPIGYNDRLGPYFKYGLYRGGSDQTSVAEFANVEIGISSLLDRVTNPLPLPR
jgi:hypothetical protein